MMNRTELSLETAKMANGGITQISRFTPEGKIPKTIRTSNGEELAVIDAEVQCTTCKKILSIEQGKVHFFKGHLVRLLLKTE